MQAAAADRWPIASLRRADSCTAASSAWSAATWCSNEPQWRLAGAATLSRCFSQRSGHTRRHMQPRARDVCETC